MTFAIITLKDHRVSPIDTLRRNFSAGMQNALPEPLASFGLGLLIGQRTTLPTDVNTQLAAVGLTHLIAVSGYNLTIIVDMVRRLTSKLSKYQSTLLAGVLIITFLLVTGFSASIVRAAIVSLLSIWAWYYGRTIRPLLLITLTAALTALWNPLYEWSDIGWYLSFLAFYGVLIIGPALTVKFCGNKKPKVIVATLLETFSAQLMTLPLIMFIFQQVSLISVLANLIVVPLVPIAMLLCLAAGISGMLVPAIAGWIAWPARLLLTYMLDAAGALSRVPHALVHYGLSTNGLIGVYITLSLLSLVLWHKVLVGHTRATRLDQFRFDEEARNKSY